MILRCSNICVNSITPFRIRHSKLLNIAIIIIHTLILFIECFKSRDSSESFILDVDDNPIISGLFHSSDKIPKHIFDKLEGEILKDEMEYCSNGVAICPDGWKFIKPTGMCNAPNDYNGFCDRMMDFSSFTDEAKIDWASSCDVHWKSCSEMKRERISDDSMTCKNGYNLSLCPYGFKFDGLSQCIPVLGMYQGPCMEGVDFSTYSEGDKMEWSKSCKAYWPCNDEEYETFSQCPLNWINESGFCKPSKDYKGPCNSKNKFTYYTKEMKKHFCISCQVYCANEGSQSVENDELNWSKPCPRGWKEYNNKNEIWCRSNSGRCSGEITFKSEVFKRAWASYCDQPWESINNNKIGYNIQSLLGGFSGPL